MTTATDKGALIELPNGSRLYYKDEDHSYWRCKPDGSRGKRLTGVSTVVKPLDFRPDGLMKWAVRLSLEGVSRCFGGETVPGDPHLLQQRLASLGLDWESIRDDAATRGTNVHEQMLHALALGGEVPNLDDLSDEERGYGQAVLKWWRDRKPRVLQSEQAVLSEEHGYAGRFDLRAEVDGFLGPVLLDAKTSGYISAAAHAQLAGYDLAAGECGIGESVHLIILQLREDGTYRELPSCATHQMFLEALATYRNAGTINGAAKKLREAA